MLFNTSTESGQGEGYSYWQRRAGTGLLRDDRRWMPRADFVIVGAGFAGLATAIRLAETAPDARIVVLERSFVGFGASGRSAGLISPLAAPIWLVTADSHPEHAWALRELNKEARLAGAWLSSRVPGSESAATQLRLESSGLLTKTGLRRVARTLEKVGIAHSTRLEGGRVLVDVPSETINPFLSVTGLASFARTLGVTIREGAAVRSVTETRDGVEVKLADGRSVEARSACVCTNAYTRTINLPSPARGSVVQTFMLATAELPEEAAVLDDVTGFVVEINMANVYFRTHRNRLLFGGIDKHLSGPAFNAARDGPAHRRLEKMISARFQNVGLATDQAWSGVYHRTATELPYLEQNGATGRILVNAGYAGTGIAMAIVMARRAAAMMLGRSVDDPDYRRLCDTIEGTKFPFIGALRFVSKVGADVILRR